MRDVFSLNVTKIILKVYASLNDNIKKIIFFSFRATNCKKSERIYDI